jgi:hypothetical protein
VLDGYYTDADITKGDMMRRKNPLKEILSKICLLLDELNQELEQIIRDQKREELLHKRVLKYQKGKFKNQHIKE